MRILGVMMLAGCYASIAPQGAPCDPAAPACPGGQTCVRIDERDVCSTGPGDPEVDAPAEVDSDGDGVLDSLDNCPAVANTRQENFDRDGFGDACDPCPPVADDRDGDEDGVADACDPEPMRPGDRIVAFDTFQRGLAAWSPVGTWRVASDGAHVDLPNGEHAVLAAAMPTGARVTVAASFTIEALRASTGYAGMSVVAEYDASDAGIACGPIRMPSSSEEVALMNTGGWSTILESAATEISIGSPTRASLTKAGDAYRCEIPTITDTSSWTAGAPRIGVRARGAAGVFHWILVTAAD